MQDLDDRVDQISKAELIPLLGWEITERRDKQNLKNMYDVLRFNTVTYHYATSALILTAGILADKYLF